MQYSPVILIFTVSWLTFVKLSKNDMVHEEGVKIMYTYFSLISVAYEDWSK